MEAGRLTVEKMLSGWEELDEDEDDEDALSQLRTLTTAERQVLERLVKSLEANQEQDPISTLFGQLPDILEDVWIDVALGEIEKARQTIDAVPRQHPFRLRYHNIRKVD